MENKEQRQEIMSRYINREDSDDGVNIFFNYQQAMQEYADLQTAQLNQTVDELRSYIKLLEKALDESPCDPDTTSEYLKAWTEAQAFKKTHNI